MNVAMVVPPTERVVSVLDTGTRRWYGGSMTNHRLTIVIEVPPRVGLPENVDPHEIAEDLVIAYNDDAEANGCDPITFIAAEWGHQLSLPFA